MRRKPPRAGRCCLVNRDGWLIPLVTAGFCTAGMAVLIVGIAPVSRACWQRGRGALATFAGKGSEAGCDVGAECAARIRRSDAPPGRQVPEGPRLGCRGKDWEIVHRPGDHVTLSAPKSISLAALIGGARVAEVRARAVGRTLACVEERAFETRMKDGESGRMARAGDQK